MVETRIEWRRVAVEVLAIVLSILLAFGLEAWWSWNQDRREEQDILAQLAAEKRAADYPAVHHSPEYESAHIPAYRVVLRRLVPATEDQ